MGGISRRLFGISPAETSFAKRGFRYDTGDLRERLEEVGRCFVFGYHTALAEDRPEPLAEKLEAVAPEFRGFSYEGAAMGLAILDAMTPWRRGRLTAFLRGPAAPHVYIVVVGSGWALARLPFPVERTRVRFDPILDWLAFDGYGFHQGYFHWQRAIVGQEVPRRVSGYALRVFDHGIGRSLWFVEGAGVERITARVQAFPARRQPDIWSGVGLACAYAGGVPRASVEDLKAAAGAHLPHLAQGAAFAAKCRTRAGNLVPHTELACQVLCGMSAVEASAVTDEVRVEPSAEETPGSHGVPAFELWRRRIQQRFEYGGTTA
ncbi:MAG TPA: DUF1702 family protein [Thermoanaerobaculia bacterium]|nr:DUF1702 family protein [Thermoanaerobaculia bacterium]